MDLYLIRHADAIPVGERGVTEDTERPLTELGQEQARRLGRLLHGRGVELERIYTSPLVRARQTAELLIGHGTPVEPAIEICPALVPSGKMRKLARFLLKQGGEKVALVGHMPHLAEFVGWLIGGGKKVQIELAKTGVAHVVCGEAPGKGLGSLQWLLSPEWFGPDEPAA